MTERFTIEKISYQPTVDCLTKALKKSNLPEGVTVYPRLPKVPSEPFVIVTQIPDLTEEIAALRAGACGYVVMDFNVDELVKKLND